MSTHFPEETEYEERGQSGRPSPTSTGNVFLPSVQETLQIENLNDNWDQTTDYIDTFTKEKEQLCQTYEECQDVVRSEFEKLRLLLTDREEELLNQLKIKYEERDESQENQIDLLENHKQLNEETENKCKNLIANMQERSQRKEREKMITNLCIECINKSPILKEVPIDLKHTFNKQKQTIDIIGDYGKLICRGMERGKSRKFTNVKTDITQTQIIVGDKNNKKSTNTIKNNKIRNGNNNYNNNNNNNYDEKENNNNVNGFNDGEKEEESVGEFEGNSNSNVNNNNIVLLSKVKLSVTVCVGNETSPKSKNVILLKNDKKNEYKLDSIKFKIKNVKLIKDLKRDDIIYKFTLLENNKEICNDNDLIKFVISQAKDEKTPINMKAQVTNVWM